MIRKMHPAAERLRRNPIKRKIRKSDRRGIIRPAGKLSRPVPYMEISADAVRTGAFAIRPTEAKAMRTLTADRSGNERRQNDQTGSD